MTPRDIRQRSSELVDLLTAAAERAEALAEQLDRLMRDRHFADLLTNARVLMQGCISSRNYLNHLKETKGGQ